MRGFFIACVLFSIGMDSYHYNEEKSKRKALEEQLKLVQSASKSVIKDVEAVIDAQSITGVVEYEITVEKGSGDEFIFVTSYTCHGEEPPRPDVILGQIAIGDKRISADVYAIKSWKVDGEERY